MVKKSYSNSCRVISTVLYGLQDINLIQQDDEKHCRVAIILLPYLKYKVICRVYMKKIIYNILGHFVAVLISWIFIHLIWLYHKIISL